MSHFACHSDDANIKQYHQPQKVLDHGYVKLIDYMGSDEAIVEAARMSTQRGFVSWDPYVRCKTCGGCWRTFAACSELGLPFESMSHIHGTPLEPCCDNNLAGFDRETFPRGDMGLLDTLMRERHTGPFEMVEIVFEVKAPLFVFREWHRHRTQSYNEMSARYIQMPNEHYLPELSRFQRQSTTNKQGSAEPFEERIAQTLQARLYREQEAVYDHYNDAVKFGLAKEVARINTPVSRYSVMRAKGNLRNLFHFLGLRKPKAAQWEIRQYADVVGDIVKAIVPRSYALFEEYMLNAVMLSATEVRELVKTLESDYEGRLGPTDEWSEQMLKKLRRA